MVSTEILVIPYHDIGHVFPATELALRLASRGLSITLFLPSGNPTTTLHPLITIQQFSPPPPPPHPNSTPAITDYILKSPVAASFAIIDNMMNHLFDDCHDRDIPVVALFTPSACSIALDHAAAVGDGTHPGREPIVVPGLPAEMAFAPAGLRRRPRGAPGPGPGPRRRKRGLAGIDGAVALVFNTCVDLERPFVEYAASCAGKPAWGVGPLLAGGPARGEPDRGVLEWLDAQPDRSVVYVCFGTRVGHAEPELAEMAAGLAGSGRRFVWVVRGEVPAADRLEKEAGGRGLVVRGWAPQLLILGHRATGAFLTHCGWNSTMEALTCGVPMLTWPIAGDQIHNSRLVTRWLKMGRALGEQGAVTRAEVVTGLEEVMADEGIRARAEEMRVRLGSGHAVPASSEESLDALSAFLRRKGKETESPASILARASSGECMRCRQGTIWKVAHSMTTTSATSLPHPQLHLHFFSPPKGTNCSPIVRLHACMV